MTRRPLIHQTLLTIGALLLVSGCELLLPGAPLDHEILDGPLEGLSNTQTSLFIRGDEEFGRRFLFSEGLGPIFNAPSCDSCHPGEGRSHPEFGFLRFGRYDEDGIFDPMHDFGGPQLQDRAVPGYPPEELPKGEGDIVTSLFLAPAITGLGLLEAIDDDTLISLSDPDDEDGDGISGRIHWIPIDDRLHDMAALSDTGHNTRHQEHDGHYIGRFGRKASNINLLHQAVSAYHQDMGLTSDFATLDPINFSVGHAAADVGPDPEVSSNVLFAVNFYLRTLRAPLRRDANDPTVQSGERLFKEAECTACHIPTLKTGEANIAPLSEVEVHAYTDLLLHDMGASLDDGYAEGKATGSEWRTPPLWGIGLAADFQGGRAFYLHDGRATTLHGAIVLHGGEAQKSRDLFLELSASEQSQLIQFLESL